MSKAHELISRKPFDLYQLHLFRLVAKSGSFTHTAQVTGLTQSAITRQVQALESQLGLMLFNRTTRTVTTTAAGAFLLAESATLLGETDNLIRRLREDYAEAPREVRVGVSNSISAAYLPGFFSQKAQRVNAVISRVSFQPSPAILESLEQDVLDLGVLFPPQRISRKLRITHRFQDTFTFLANAEQLAAAGLASTAAQSKKALSKWMQTQPWLGLAPASQTAIKINAWLKEQNITVKPAMELDNFDLIINLVAAGLGVSLVPQRALALYNRRSSLMRIAWPKPFRRELVVLIRNQRKTPAHIAHFVEHILF